MGVGSAAGKPSRPGEEGGEEADDSHCKDISLLDAAGALGLRLPAVAVFAEGGLSLSLRFFGWHFLRNGSRQRAAGCGVFRNVENMVSELRSDSKG